MIIKSQTIRDSTGRILAHHDFTARPSLPSSPSVQRSAPPGLGDRVERFAQPIARAIDRLLGTKLASCGGCKKRRDWLNRHFRS